MRHLIFFRLPEKYKYAKGIAPLHLSCKALSILARLALTDCIKATYRFPWIPLVSLLVDHPVSTKRKPESTLAVHD